MPPDGLCNGSVIHAWKGRVILFRSQIRSVSISQGECTQSFPRGLCVLLLTFLLVGRMGGQVAELQMRSGETHRGVVEFTSAGLSRVEAGGRTTSVAPAQLRRVSFDRYPSDQIQREATEPVGLEVRYYTNSLFEGQALSVAVPGLEHEGSLRQRTLAASPTGFSVRWLGQIISPSEGVYRFVLRSKVPARLWVEASCVGCIASNLVLRESVGHCFLRQGQRASFVMEQSGVTTEEVPQVFWGSPVILTSALSPRFLVPPKGRDVLSEITQGLLVTYYGNSRLEGVKLTRVERGIGARWEAQPPFPELGMGWGFSAVWEGRLAVPISGSFRLAVEAEGGVQVTLNDRPTLRRWTDKKGDPADIASFPVFLDSHRTYPLKVEYFNEYAPARLRVYWFPSQGLQSPPFENQLIPAEPADRSWPVEPHRTGNVVDEGLDRGCVLLVDGTRTWQLPLTSTRSQLQLSPGALPNAMPLDLVSRLQLSGLTPSARLQSDLKRTGVLLLNGDFLEGDIQSMDAEEIRMSSILFGNHRIRRDQVCAILLRPLRASLPEWEVLTIHGGCFRAREIVFSERKLTLKGNSAGVLDFPQDSVLQILNHSK